MKSAREGGQSQDIWEIREGGLGSIAFARGEDNWPGWEDSAVPPSRLGRYVVDLRELMNSHGIKGAMYGHFGRGCIHCRLSFDLRTGGGIANYRAFLEEAAAFGVKPPRIEGSALLWGHCHHGATAAPVPSTGCWKRRDCPLRR